MTAPSSKESLRKAGKTYAEKTIKKTFENSKVLDNAINFPTFSKQEITLGKVLGKGGFGTVYEVRGFEAGKPTKPLRKSVTIGDEDDSFHSEEGMESRKFIADHCVRTGGDARYAAKLLSPEVIDDPPTFIQGIMDMATETRVLSDISHPNIIRMRACASVTPYDEEYFIVMDRLYDTLESRIGKWGKKNKRNSSFLGKVMLDRKGHKTKNLMEEKLVAAFDLSAAIGYMHDRKILYRDLKPENIGFDIRDDVKVFDFGLAKELTEDMKPDEDGNFKLTAMTGSPRYMAPEVAMELPYNEKCDTYSFAILLWQMYSCKTPFELYTMKSLKTRVWTGEKKRPFIDDKWPVPIKNLLRRSWSAEISERPAMSAIYKILRTECVRVRDGNDDGLEHERRRSTFVFRGAKGGQLTSTKSSTAVK
eukprot:CAMPEP_0117026072 /NCGR_PEP_ID=MMETSP0472-20121206/19193_1 /TAXON_ID=693140 ORGANISM="Tiarina fusus, Strain LIS" /NCGR_SAMPLE_ID=MMETSP0472 /ASSEMBLY_ACC=CAM_ASM_000603 /LENGTH=419 /DNA_ID=CAMNT_0004732957 /DNA_START=74 /DNA_END=1333 /DNA_ORIENTATION=-